MFRQPGQPFRLTRHADRLEGQRRPAQVAPRDRQTRPQDGDQVVQDAIVGRRRGAQEAEVRRQGADHAFDQAVVGAEIVPPIRDAMRLVDHEQGDASGDRAQDLAAKMLARQPLGRDQEDVDLVASDRGLDGFPLRPVLRMDGLRSHAHTLGRDDLVAHQGEQGRDQERRSQACLPQQLGRDEIDRTLAPARLLHDERSPEPFHHMPDRVLLALAKDGGCVLRAQPQKFERARRIVMHGAEFRGPMRRPGVSCTPIHCPASECKRCSIQPGMLAGRTRPDPDVGDPHHNHIGECHEPAVGRPAWPPACRSGRSAGPLKIPSRRPKKGHFSLNATGPDPGAGVPCEPPPLLAGIGRESLRRGPAQGRDRSCGSRRESSGGWKMLTSVRRCSPCGGEHLQRGVIPLEAAAATMHALSRAGSTDRWPGRERPGGVEEEVPGERVRRIGGRRAARRGRKSVGIPPRSSRQDTGAGGGVRREVSKKARINQARPTSNMGLFGNSADRKREGCPEKPRCESCTVPARHRLPILPGYPGHGTRRNPRERSQLPDWQFALPNGLAKSARERSQPPDWQSSTQTRLVELRERSQSCQIGNPSQSFQQRNRANEANPSHDLHELTGFLRGCRDPRVVPTSREKG